MLKLRAWRFVSPSCRPVAQLCQHTSISSFAVYTYAIRYTKYTVQCCVHVKNSCHSVIHFLAPSSFPGLIGQIHYLSACTVLVRAYSPKIPHTVYSMACGSVLRNRSRPVSCGRINIVHCMLLPQIASCLWNYISGYALFGD